MRSIENPDRLSAGLARGNVEGIRFRVRASGTSMVDWVVLSIRDAEGHLHELRFGPDLFAELGGIGKIGELRGREVAGAAVHADFFGAPGGEPVRVSQEMLWILTGPHRGQLLESRYETGPNGRSSAIAARDGAIGPRLNGRALSAEPTDGGAPRSLYPMKE